MHHLHSRFLQLQGKKVSCASWNLFYICFHTVDFVKAVTESALLNLLQLMGLPVISHGNADLCYSKLDLVVHAAAWD